MRPILTEEMEMIIWIRWTLRSTTNTTNVDIIGSTSSIKYCGGPRAMIYNNKIALKYKLQKQINTLMKPPLNPSPFPIKQSFLFENHPT